MSKIGKVTVDKDLCIGSASCVAVLPEVFDLGEDGKAYVKEGSVASADPEAILDAARSCPVNAIIVTDADGNQIHP